MAALRLCRTSARCITRGIWLASPAAQAVVPPPPSPRGIGPLSYGTETGSSVRRPASYCGIVGFKPTFGIISRLGSFRGAWSQDHVGLFARTVKDIALALDPVAGHDARDPASVREDGPAYAERLNGNLRRPARRRLGQISRRRRWPGTRHISDCAQSLRRFRL